VRKLGESKAVREVSFPVVVSAASDGAKAFQAGEIAVQFSESVAGALDVRDKLELAQLRQARRRDLLLWRGALGGVAALLLLGLGELALIGGASWEKSRLAVVKAQRPTVEKLRRRMRSRGASRNWPPNGCGPLKWWRFSSARTASGNRLRFGSRGW
jgi:hypothetical protein